MPQRALEIVGSGGACRYTGPNLWRKREKEKREIKRVLPLVNVERQTLGQSPTILPPPITPPN